MKRRGIWQWVWCWLGMLMAGCAARGSTGTGVTLNGVPLATLPRPLPTLPPLTPLWRVIRPALGGSGTHTASQDSLPQQTELSRTDTATVPFGTLPALTLEPLACYPANPNGWWCAGAIRNPLSVPCVGIMVQIVLLDLKNLPLAMETVPAARSLIFPGEEIPYSILFRDTPESVGGATVTLTGGVALAEPDDASSTHRLTVTGVAFDANGIVRGTVINSSVHAVSITALATLFDASDRVLGYREIDDADPLPAGATRSIEIIVTPLTGGVQIARTRLLIDER